MDKRYGILIVSVTILVLCFVGTASATNWTVDGSGGADFSGIQEAINNASVGDTIIVHFGVYYENVVVDKSVTLIGIGQPVVDPGWKGSAITLTADGITLEGFTATGSSLFDAGIEIISSNNIITGSNVNNNWEGILLYHSSNNNTITSNNVSNNDYGILLYHSCNNNTVIGNNVSNNNYAGINLYYSSNNTITGNTLVNDGLFVFYSYQNTVEDNIVNGKPLVYLEDVSDCKVEDAGQVILVSCNNITVENLDLSNTRVGVEFWKTEDSKVLNNNASNNDYGIYLWDSSNNIITGNNASNNRRGILLFHSCNNNTVIGNNVSNNNYKGIYLDFSSNNTITGNNVSSYNYDGIHLSFSSNNTITGNNISNHHWHGISLRYASNNNIITGNNVSNNNYNGIYLDCSSNNTITSNNVSNNNDDGIRFYYSSNNTITGNNVSNNDDAIGLYYSSNNTITGNTLVNDGLFVRFSYQNTVEDNIINGKPLVYLEDVSDCKVEDAGQVILVSCNNITVENLDLSNTRVGVEFWKTEDSKVLNNNASNNNLGGIYLWDSSNNTITGNNVSNNDDGIILRGDSSSNSITGNNVSNNKQGIYISSSSNNTIYFNNFINNTYNVDSLYSTNIWNSALEITYTYDGTTYESYLGNYWDDCEGTDADGDGIGDTHYSIDSEEDESDDYPLMKPFENYILPRSAPT